MPKYALLIGSNYTATPSAALQGCINDVVNVRNTLIDAYGYQDANVIVLRDDDKSRLPTKYNILAAMNYFITIASATDTLWIHYSGHGSQIKCLTGDESDGLNEVIVPCDFISAGFIDDNAIYSIIRKAKCRLILCFDSCHSGTVCDLQYSMNYNNGILTKVVNNSLAIAGTNIIMLSGCRDAQTSADAYNNFAKQGAGAFTITLLETLRANDHNIALLPLYQNICLNLRRAGFSQIPVLSSSVSNPSYQFARSNANGTTVVSSSVSTAVSKKDLVNSLFSGGNNSRNQLDASIFPRYNRVSRSISMQVDYTS